MTLTTCSIRAFTNNDYVALAAIQNATFTEFAQTADEIRFDDEKRPAKCLHRRWIAEREGHIVGVATYDQHPWVYHPRKFSIDVTVAPEHLQQGIGTTLWTCLVDGLREHEPLSVDFWSRDDMTCRVRFLEARGFVPGFRMWASELDLGTFDATQFEPYARQTAEAGVEIKSLTELRDDPERNRKVYEMWLQVRDDVPLPPGEVRTPTPFEEWLEDTIRPTFREDGYFIAVVDGQYVGTSAFWTSPEADQLKTGLTAVKREYRRRGIALALKLRALEYARAQGFRRVVTDNEQGNRGMLAINERLGFVKRPAWVRYDGDWSVVGR